MKKIAQVLFPPKANGQWIQANGKVIGSRIIGQPFSGPGYFQSRPSAAGNGYDPTNSNRSQLGPTNHQLIDRVKGDVATLQAENPGTPIPIDLVTTSASGLDPEISPAAAYFQVPRVARERKLSEDDVRRLVGTHVAGRQWGFLGEPRVNVLQLNFALDSLRSSSRAEARPGNNYTISLGLRFRLVHVFALAAQFPEEISRVKREAGRNDRPCAQALRGE